MKSKLSIIVIFLLVATVTECSVPMVHGNNPTTGTFGNTQSGSAYTSYSTGGTFGNTAQSGSTYTTYGTGTLGNTAHSGSTYTGIDNASTMGESTNSGTSYTTLNANEYCEGNQFTSPAGAYEVVSVHIYGESVTNSVDCKAIITDASGNILTYGVSSNTTLTTTAGAYTFTFSTPPTISPNINYTLLVESNGTNAVRLYYVASPSPSYMEEHGTCNNFNNPTGQITLTHSNDTSYRAFYGNAVVYSAAGGEWTTASGEYELDSVEFYAVASAGTISANAIVTDTSGNIIGGAGSVGTTVTVTTTAGWWISTFSSPLTITSGTTYCLLIGMGTTSGVLRLYYSATSGGTQEAGNPTSFSSPSTPITIANTNATLYSLYANVEICSANGGEWSSSAGAYQINSVEFYGAASSGTVSAEAIVTDTSGNIEGGVVGTSDTVTTTAGWWTSTFSSPITISSSTTYCLLIVCQGSSGNALRLYYSATTGGTQENGTASSFASPSSPITITNTNTTLYSLYANIGLLNAYGGEWPSSAGAYQITSVEFYGASSSATLSANAIITTTSGVIVGEVGSTVSVTASAGWWTSTFSPAISINPSTTYCLLIDAQCSGGSGLRLYYSATSGGTEESGTPSSFSSPGTITLTNSNAILYSLYANIDIAFSLNLLIQDRSAGAALSGAIVDMNNGTDYNITSSATGWANYTAVSGTITIKVAYYGYWVNGTFSYTVSSNTTLTLICNVYNIQVKMVESARNALLGNVNCTIVNATGSIISQGVTANTGLAACSLVPNATVYFTCYGGTTLIYNATNTPSSDDSVVTCTANLNSISSEEAYNIVGRIH